MAVVKLLPSSLEFFNAFFKSDFSGVKVHSSPWLRRMGLAGIALGKRNIVLSAESVRDYLAGRPGGIALVGHELCHVRQWQQMGIFRFLCCYLGEYLYLRLVRRKSHAAAYRSLSLEEAAFDAEQQILHLLQQDGVLRRLGLPAEVEHKGAGSSVGVHWQAERAGGDR